MQNPTCKLSTVLRLIEETLFFLKHYSEIGFEEAKTKATELTKSVDAEAVFPVATQIRVRRKKRIFNYESRDIPI